MKSKRDAIDVLIYAFFGLALCQLTYYLTIEYSNAGTATVLQYMAPVIILAITCFCDKRVPFANEVICMILALSGVFFLATHGSLNSLALSPKALIIGIISAFTVVVYNMQPARLLKKHSPVVLSTLLLGTHFAVMDIVGFICILSAIFILALTKNHKHGSVDKKSVL